MIELVRNTMVNARSNGVGLFRKVRTEKSIVRTSVVRWVAGMGKAMCEAMSEARQVRRAKQSESQGSCVVFLC